MAAPLSGVRVVALEHAVSAPLCTRHLADLGADVVKVERPGSGDFARHYDSMVKGQSAHFVWLNRGKRSVVLDLRQDADRRVMEKLMERADVFVHNLGPGAVERLGFGWDVIHPRWPRLISCAISGYGVGGPYQDRKAFDLLLQGESGMMAITGTSEQPAKVGISIADLSAGMYALSAILAALLQRELTGEAAWIHIAMLDCLAEWMSVPLYQQAYTGAPPPRTGMRHSSIVPYGPYRVGNGTLINLAVQNEGQWRRLCEEVLDRPELADDPRFRTNEDRVRHRDLVDRILEESFGAATAPDLASRLEAADVPFGAVNEVADLLRHRQLEARQRWFEIGSPFGAVLAVKPPFDLNDLVYSRTRVPELGEHTAEIRRELGLAGES